MLRLPTSDADGAEVVADLWDGPGLGLSVLGFSPVAGDPRLLALHERSGRPVPFLWDPTTGSQVELGLADLPGDLAADWYEDGAALLVVAEQRGRSTMHRLDLASGALTTIDTPRGTVGGATPRPDGTVEYTWSSAAEPTVVRSTSGAVVLTAPGPAAPGSVPVEDVEVEGPGGRVHALLARPAGSGPHPTVFLVHGGPTWNDSDAFAADRAAYVDLGCATVEVNYRGSTGYGREWRDALAGRPGLTELEDLAAVRAALVGRGVADPDRLALTGGSWGGYLTLLGLGTQPDLWSVGVAAVPVADYVAAYEDEMEPLKAFDRSLFGGSPDRGPRRLRAGSSPTDLRRGRPGAGARAGRGERPALPAAPDRQLARGRGRAGQGRRGLPVRRRARLAGGRRAGPPTAGRAGVRHPPAGSGDAGLTPGDGLGPELPLRSYVSTPCSSTWPTVSR